MKKVDEKQAIFYNISNLLNGGYISENYRFIIKKTDFIF